MNINDLTLGQIKDIQSLLVIGKIDEKEDSRNGTRQIVVLDRGWIVVGVFNYSCGLYTITDSSVIRQWGTKNGLGEIALNGPTNETILDVCGKIETKNIIFTMDCSEKWED